MNAWTALVNYMGERSLAIWIVLFAASGIVLGIYRGFFAARRIQPNRFRWDIFRKEIFFATITITLTSTAISFVTSNLKKHGYITSNHDPVGWWVVAFEFALSFFLFDTYFYWLHRWMHKKPFYEWIHKIHHYSTSPNLLTTLSVSPLESFVNGAFIPLFLTIYTVHDQSLALITPCNVLMGLYVHCGYEFLPRWWNKTWATKWFITTTFHDQHHKYFNYNFGGYTTIWDRLCGTMRSKYEADFDKIKARLDKPIESAAINATPET
jgi:Delta7-sterol 5-desaturase